MINEEFFPKYELGSCGLNLQTFTMVFNFCPADRYQNYVQGYARAYRNGQTQPVDIFRLYSNDSYDEEIHKAHNSGQEFLEDVYALSEMDGDGATYEKVYSWED